MANCLAGAGQFETAPTMDYTPPDAMRATAGEIHMRVSLAAVLVVSLFVHGSAARSDEDPQETGHAAHSHSSNVDSTQASPPFAGGECPPRDATTRADMTALGIIERCADIDLLPNSGGFKVATYLRVDAPRARGSTADGITVETAPGRATFRIPHLAVFEGYAICNLDRSIRSEVPRSGRFKPKHGWVYQDARMASYQWDVKARVAQGSTAPHLRVFAYIVAIPTENLEMGIERKWCRPVNELGSLQRKQ